MMAAPPLVRHRRRPGTIAWLIAASCLLMMLAAAAVLALGQAARTLEDAVARRVIVQVIDPDRGRRDALAVEALALLQARHDVVALHRLDTGEVARLIGPYLGSAGLADLPVPALIDLTVTPDADIPAIAGVLGRLGPISVERAGAGLAPLARLIATMRAIGFAVAGIAVAATAAIAILAARAAFAAEAATVAILHGLGATDGQIARAITGQIARDAAIGGAIGTLLTVAAMTLLAHRIAALGAGVQAVSIGWSGWTVLAALLLGLIALATAAAHAALLIRLGRAP